MVLCVWRGKPGDFVCRDRESIALRSVDVSTYCRRRLQASLKYSLCDLKAMLPTSAWINQYIPKFLYCLDYYSSVFCAPCGLSLRFIWCHLAPENQHYFPGRPHVITSCPPRLACVRTPSGEQTKAKHVIKSSHWSQPVCLSVALCWCYCDIKQTGDLHYSSGLRGQGENGCHGNGPLHGCQNCLIIQDRHHRASAGNRWSDWMVRLKIDVSCAVVAGIQINLPRIHDTVAVMKSPVWTQGA